MELCNILNMGIKNGRFISLETETTKTYKGMTIVKKSKLSARYGVNYYNLKEVKQNYKENSTEKEGTIKLPWFEHTEFKSIVKNKKDPSKIYIQIVNPKVLKTRYYKENGQEVSQRELIESGWLKEEKKPLTLTISIENVKAIHYKEV